MKLIGLILLAGFMMAGCRPRNGDTERLQQQIDVEKTDIAVLTKRVQSLEESLQQAESVRQIVDQTVTKVTADLQLEMFKKVNREEPAVLDPRSRNYDIARAPEVNFAVSLKNAEPYLDGHKLKFDIGNLGGSTILNAAISVTYGPRDPDIPKSMDDRAALARAWEKYNRESEAAKAARKTLQLDSTRELKAGVWTPVEAIVAPSKPEDLGRIEVLIRPGGVSLSVDR